MVTPIDPSASKPRVPLATTHRAPESKQQTDIADDASSKPRTHVEIMLDMADNLSAVLAGMRQRSKAEKQSPNTVDPYERILEEEVVPKVEQLLFIAQSSEIVPSEFLAQARALFPDDSDLILVLREIIRRRKLKNEETGPLEEVMQQVWADSNEKKTKAGMNIGFKAQIFAKKMAVTPWALRDTYRDFLTSGETELSQYEQWVGQYGGARRGLVAEFIETSLLHDIQSHDPSCSQEEFGILLGFVVNFRRIQYADNAFVEVFVKRKKHHKEKKHGKQPEQETTEEADLEAEILACWFDVLQRPFKIKKEIEKNKLATLMTKFKLSHAELQQKMIRAIKLLDGELFFDAEAKDILIEALLSN